LPAAYLLQVVEQVRALGVDVDVWLLRAGLTAETLAATAGDLPLHTFERLVLDGLTLTREPALGLFVGQRLQVQTHGVLGYAAQSSGSVRQALGLLGTFIRTRFSLVALTVDEGRATVRVRFDETLPLGAVQRPVLEAVVLAVKNLLDAISMGACHFEAASFPFAAPAYAPLARQLFACDVRYGAPWAGLTLPRGVLDVPLRAADPIALREAVNICERELERVASAVTYAGRVRRLLLERQHGFPSLEVAARQLFLTPRTLHRRLVDEGTSFRALLEDVRHRLAVEHLKVGRFSLEELAWTLGYTDFANFRRAFKRWEGVPPGEYRRRQARASSTRTSQRAAPHHRPGTRR
jgi:AraC-like DNA-binding protein